MTAASALIFMRLPRDAGAALSGHVGKSCHDSAQTRLAGQYLSVTGYMEDPGVNV